MCPGPEAPAATLRPKLLRTLRLRVASAPGRPAFISAASGLVRAGRWLHVIADDELHLGVFPAAGIARGSLVRLLPGTLPRAPGKRKAQKADFEALALLPAFSGCPHGALIALGSGSRPNRQRGVLAPLGPSGTIIDVPRPIDLSGLYARIAERVGEVNVEGAVVIGQHLVLLNRGHPRRGGSSTVRLNLRAVLAGLARRDAVGAVPARIRCYDLGEASRVPLGFTDGAALPDGSLIFTAVAESARDSYRDGPCLASAVGKIGPAGQLEWIGRLEPALKVEGIAARRAGGRLQLLLVTDADDAAVPAGLYSTSCADQKKGPRRTAPGP